MEHCTTNHNVHFDIAGTDSETFNDLCGFQKEEIVQSIFELVNKGNVFVWSNSKDTRIVSREATKEAVGEDDGIYYAILEAALNGGVPELLEAQEKAQSLRDKIILDSIKASLKECDCAPDGHEFIEFLITHHEAA